MGTVNQNVEQVSKFCSMLQVYNTMYTITAPRQNIVSRAMHYYWFRPLVTFSACTDVIHFFLWQIWDISNSKSGVNYKLLIFLDDLPFSIHARDERFDSDNLNHNTIFGEEQPQIVVNQNFI